jgi:hypothetical protein
MGDGPKGDQLDFNPPPASFERGSADIFSPVIVESGMLILVALVEIAST